jgi:hypothetical protein
MPPILTAAEHRDFVAALTVKTIRVPVRTRGPSVLLPGGVNRVREPVIASLPDEGKLYCWEMIRQTQTTMYLRIKGTPAQVAAVLARADVTEVSPDA